MSKEQNEVLEQQRYLLERRMYRLDPAPPKLPPQEYIELYLAEKGDKYLLWYLHDREPMLNKLAQDACQRYGLPEHFVDIKQAAVCGILTALQKYDPSIGTPFAVYQRQYITDSIEDYIRTAQSGVITMTTDTYPVLRRIMAIYHQSGDDCSDDILRLVQIIDDITDAIDEVILDAYMYHIDAIPENTAELSRIVNRCVKALQEAADELKNFKKPDSLRALLVKVNDIEIEADNVYTDAIYRLFRSSSDVKALLGAKAIYESLEHCCDLCEHAADVIEQVIIKNS